MATINTNTVKEVVKAQGIRPYQANAIRPLLIEKNASGQRRAINARQAEDAGLGEAFDQWEYKCDRLYESAIAYSNALTTIDEGPAREELFGLWKDLLKCGEEDALHPRMWVRRHDADNLRVLAAESDELHVEGIGFVPTVKGRTAFRAKIEIRIACRIAGNTTLTDEERDVLTEMKRAERNIKAAEEVINGNGKTGDEFVPGIESLISGAEADLEILKKSLDDAKVAEPEKYLREKIARVNDLRNRKDAATKKLARAKKSKEKIQDEYDGIIARLERFEE